MAIVGQFEVTISCDGQVLEEHPELNEDGRDVFNGEDIYAEPTLTSIQYVEAAPDQDFQINYNLYGSYHLEDPANYIHWTTTIDGKKVQGLVMIRSTDHSVRPQLTSVAGPKVVQGQSSYLRRYRFANTEIGENVLPKISSDILQRFSKLGSVIVHIWPQRGMVDPQQTRKDCHLGLDTVDQKVVKGKEISMTATLGELEKVSPTTFYRGDKIGEKPLATFVFKYRTRKALARLGLVEVSPEPVPLEDRPFESLTDEEKKVLFARMKGKINVLQGHEQKPAIKYEKVHEGVNTRPCASKRRIAIADEDDIGVVENPSKKLRGPPEVIDLSED